MKKYYFVLLCCLPLAIFAQTAKDLFEQGKQAQTQQDYEKAVQFFEKAAKLDKKNPEIHAQWGWTLIKLTKYGKALGNLKVAQKINQKEARYIYYQAVALDSMRREREVIEATNKALKLESNMPEMYVLRANIYIRKKDYNTAIANLNKAIELDAKSGLAYLKRAYARYRVVDSSGACSDWRKAQSLGQDEAQKYIEQYCKE